MTIELTREERLTNMDRMVEAKTIQRGQWKACLLSALSPEVEQAEDAGKCPSWLMSPTLAHLTPWLDDSPSAYNWWDVVTRYSALAHRWHVLDDTGWQRFDYRARLVTVDEARKHVSDMGLLTVIDRVRDLLLSSIDGELIPSGQWAAAEAAAAEAVKWSSMAASDAAWAAAAAARSAAWAASSADRIADGILDALEYEIVQAEAANG